MSNESKAVELLRRIDEFEKAGEAAPSIDRIGWYYRKAREWNVILGEARAFLRTYDAAPQEPDAMALMRQVEALTPGGSEFVMPDGWNNAIRFIETRMRQTAAIAKERNELRAQMEAQR